MALRPTMHASAHAPPRGPRDPCSWCTDLSEQLCPLALQVIYPRFQRVTLFLELHHPISEGESRPIRQVEIPGQTQPVHRHTPESATMLITFASAPPNV